LYTCTEPGEAVKVFYDPNLLSEDGTTALSSIRFSIDGPPLRMLKVIARVLKALCPDVAEIPMLTMHGQVAEQRLTKGAVWLNGYILQLLAHHSCIL
jgi:hypothetical protein